MLVAFYVLCVGTVIVVLLGLLLSICTAAWIIGDVWLGMGDDSI